jgi:hypothetical protein
MPTGSQLPTEMKPNKFANTRWKLMGQSALAPARC